MIIFSDPHRSKQENEKRCAAFIALGIALSLAAGCVKPARDEASDGGEAAALSTEQTGGNEEGAEASGKEASALPAYVYTGEDPYVRAVCGYFSDKNADKEEGAVYIPAPDILKVEKKGNDAFLYGRFWDFWYEKRERTLFCVRGGENTGRLRVSEKAGVPEIAAFEQVGDGGDYAEDLRRICGENQDAVLWVRTEYLTGQQPDVRQ